MRFLLFGVVFCIHMWAVEYYCFVDSDEHTPKILQSFGLGYDFLPEQTDQRNAIESSAQ